MFLCDIVKYDREWHEMVYLSLHGRTEEDLETFYPRKNDLRKMDAAFASPWFDERNKRDTRQQNVGEDN